MPSLLRFQPPVYGFYTVSNISDFRRSRQKHGLDGLADAPEPGRRRKIDGSLEALRGDILIENPSSNMEATLRAEVKEKTDTSLEWYIR